MTAEKLPEETSEAVGKNFSPPTEEGSLALAELVFPLKSIPLVITSLPKSFLPLQGPETLSHYRCQYPSCNREFSQKAAACNHVHCDHLNIALACLYCSFETTLKCIGTVLLTGSAIPTNMHKRTSLFILMTQHSFNNLLKMKLSHLPPPLHLNSPMLMSSAKELKQLNTSLKMKVINLHSLTHQHKNLNQVLLRPLSIALNKVLSNQAKSEKKSLQMKAK